MNLFKRADPPAVGEAFDTLWRTESMLVERIRSAAVTEPIEYRQEHDEWVVLLRGSAQVRLDGRLHSLGPGDYLALPAGTAHTVVSVGEGSLWLAVHAPSPADGALD